MSAPRKTARVGHTNSRTVRRLLIGVAVLYFAGFSAVYIKFERFDLLSRVSNTFSRLTRLEDDDDVVLDTMPPTGDTKEKNKKRTI